MCGLCLEFESAGSGDLGPVTRARGSWDLRFGICEQELRVWDFGGIRRALVFAQNCTDSGGWGLRVFQPRKRPELVVMKAKDPRTKKQEN